MDEGHQRGVELPHDVMDHVIAGDVVTLRGGERCDLAMDRRDKGRGLV
jgi:hypothetical protein